MIKLKLCLVILISMVREITNQRNPTLVISIDGLTQSSLDKYLAANFNSFMRKEFEEVGVKADYMTTSFPSMKFPNYFSMSTGSLK